MARHHRRVGPRTVAEAVRRRGSILGAPIGLALAGPATVCAKIGRRGAPRRPSQARQEERQCDSEQNRTEQDSACACLRRQPWQWQSAVHRRPPTPTVTVSDVQVEIATNPETGNPMGRRITGLLQLADPGTPAADPSPRIAALIWRGETASRRTCEHEFPDGITPGESYEFEIICSAPRQRPVVRVPRGRRPRQDVSLRRLRTQTDPLSFADTGGRTTVSVVHRSGPDRSVAAGDIHRGTGMAAFLDRRLRAERRKRLAENSLTRASKGRARSSAG